MHAPIQMHMIHAIQILVNDWLQKSHAHFEKGIKSQQEFEAHSYFVACQHEGNNYCKFRFQYFLRYFKQSSFSCQCALFGVFALQANAAITSVQKPGAFSEAVTGTDKFIDICSGQAAYTLEDGKAAVIYTSGPLASATQM